MDKQRRKELQAQYKEIKTYMGVVQLTNTANGKIWIGSYPNLKNKEYSIRMQLDGGRFANAELQRDWKELGSAAFTYEVLEEQSTEDVVNKPLELRAMEAVWLEKLQPYGNRGYNREKK